MAKLSLHSFISIYNIGTSSCSNLPIATALPPPPPNTGSDGTTPPEQSQPTDRVVSHDIPPSNSTDKPIVPTPTISSRDESIEGNGSASDTNNTADLTVGVVVALILIVVLSLTVAIPISVVVLLKVCKARKSTIPTDTNIAYGVTHQELTSTEPLSNATYEYPEVIRPSSMVYNAAYPTNNCSARNPIFWADYQDANEAVSETST